MIALPKSIFSKWPSLIGTCKVKEHQPLKQRPPGKSSGICHHWAFYQSIYSALSSHEVVEVIGGGVGVACTEPLLQASQNVLLRDA